MERAVLVTVDFGKRDVWSAEERSADSLIEGLIEYVEAG